MKKETACLISRPRNAFRLCIHAVGQHRGNTHTHRSTRTRSRTHPGADIHPVSGTRADNGRIR